LVLACGESASTVDSGATAIDTGVVVPSDAGSLSDARMAVDAADAGAAPDAEPTDLSTPDVGPPDSGAVTLVTVGGGREMRGVWVATVSNLDFPSRTNLSPAQGRSALNAIVTRTASAGLNAIFFQVRPESDALYRSSLEPWSRFLTGTQGQDPGYDPLGILLELAHAKHLEVHAWINPYRGLTSTNVTAAPNHVTRTLSSHAINYGGAVVMDPAAAPVRAHVLSVVRELLEHYPVDGVHFDDYFYPYPDASNTPFPDTESWDAYTAGGGPLSRGDWRRDNVNALVRETADLVRQVRPSVRFGISPFGIYKNGVPAGIRGLDAYATIYCDSVLWMQQGWVDYLAPQLYWPTTQTAQAYGTLASWWASTSTGGRHIFPGHALSRLGSSAAWTAAEIQAQIEITRGLRDQHAEGDLHFSYRHLDQNLSGIYGLLSTSLYQAMALPPAVPRTLPIPAPPTVIARPGELGIDHPARGELSGFGLYRSVGGNWVLERVLASDAVSARVSAGSYAVSALGPGDTESLGAAVEL
jgi:uncharacterized lipoprotein YddW (UPF0748 family)